MLRLKIVNAKLNEIGLVMEKNAVGKGYFVNIPLERPARAYNYRFGKTIVETFDNTIRDLPFYRETIDAMLATRLVRNNEICIGEFVDTYKRVEKMKAFL